MRTLPAGRLDFIRTYLEREIPQLGPTAIVLKQTGPWTYGMLVNQLWNMGGPDWQFRYMMVLMFPK